jgi:hypothetical protein
MPREELVGSRAHRLKNQVRLGAPGDREDSHASLRCPETLDGRHARRRVSPDVDNGDIRCRGVAARSRLEDADRHPAGAQQLRRLALELVVVRDD